MAIWATTLLLIPCGTYVFESVAIECEGLDP